MDEDSRKCGIFHSLSKIEYKKNKELSSLGQLCKRLLNKRQYLTRIILYEMLFELCKLESVEAMYISFK